MDLEAAIEPPTRVHSAFAINASGQILANQGPLGTAPLSGQVVLTPR